MPDGFERIQFTVHGHLHSLKNSRNIGRTHTGRLFPLKGRGLQEFEMAFAMQCPKSARQYLTCDVLVTVDAYYPNRRHDLDCAVVYDLLQKCEVLKNDRQVKQKIETCFLDRGDPRVEVTVEALPCPK